MMVAVSDVDLPRIEAAVREILLAIGEDPERDGLQNTPSRVARMYAETMRLAKLAADWLQLNVADYIHKLVEEAAPRDLGGLRDHLTGLLEEAEDGKKAR